MAAHSSWPPAGSDAIVRGDPTTFVLRLRPGGAEVDITGWTWRSFVRDRLDGSLVSECETFDVVTPDDLPEMFPDDPGSTPCVLLVHWTTDQTALWKSGYVADVEQLTPALRTWLIIDSLRVDKDVSYTSVTYPDRRRLGAPS
jgi:hypothetical protein